MTNKRPEIRFSGFTDDWKQCKLGQNSVIKTGGTPKTGISEYWFPKEIPWMSSGEVNKKRLFNTDNQISKKGLENSSARWIKEKSILIALAGQGKTRGTVAINEIPLTTNQSIAAIEVDSSFDAEFVFQNLENRYEELRMISSGDGTRGGLNKQLVADINVVAPSVEEQREIGLIFKQLDIIISLHQCEHEKFVNLKKAMLQKMFPHNGKCVPEIRFKGFTNDWEQSNLGDCINYIKGFAFKSEDYRSDGIRIVRVSDLSSNEIKFDNEKIFLDREYENDYKKYKLNVGDIIITTVGSKVELKESAVGRPIIVNKENEGLLNQNLVKISPQNGYNSYFIYGNLLQERYMNYIGSIERGNANQANIAISDLWQYKVYLTSNEEQEKIGNFFKQLDGTIILHQEQLNKLQQIKKSMLQKMFI
ncbi:restriction endonuclease subunit S [Bacillus sp. GZT]|uniref:restriction endonuclease subunit S n=1 Tax=Bacillus sp. GZT TaxID=936600 RepID=UPI0009FC8534|nr:restriction endonuclease subunit S [Bacillus sp. GZT]